MPDLSDVDGVVAYLVVAVLAAIPWVEIAVVIPLAILAGLSPLPVAVWAFVGNLLPVLGIVWLHARWERWRHQRHQRHQRDPSGGSLQGGHGRGDAGARELGGRASGTRGQRGRRVFARWGLPGLALAGPAVTGIHLAAMVALAVGCERRPTTAWMAASLAAWTLVATVLGVAGRGLVDG